MTPADLYHEHREIFIMWSHRHRSVLQPSAYQVVLQPDVAFRYAKQCYKGGGRVISGMINAGIKLEIGPL